MGEKRRMRGDIEGPGDAEAESGGNKSTEGGEEVERRCNEGLEGGEEEKESRLEE
jgi:hypothetical protein